MVVPVLLRHKRRHAKAEQRCSHSHTGLSGLRFQCCIDPVYECQHTQADPNTERVERTRISVVSFTRLVRRLVEVQHDSQARQEEQQEGQSEVFPPFAFALRIAFATLPNDTDNAKQQRQEIIDVMAFVFLQFRRQQVLVAKHGVINERDTGDPVTFGDIAV